jgi:hypothetical protein
MQNCAMFVIHKRLFLVSFSCRIEFSHVIDLIEKQITHSLRSGAFCGMGVGQNGNVWWEALEIQNGVGKRQSSC